jgi:hypothetical protein
MRYRRAAGAAVVLVAIALIAIAAPSILDNLRREKPITNPTPPATGDPLFGVWQSRTTKEQLKSLALSRFPQRARTAPWEAMLSDFYRQNGSVGLNTVNFGGGEITVTTFADDGPGEGEWDGQYMVVDDHTFVAGDHGNFYITLHYRIVGDQLTVHVVKDLFPPDLRAHPPAVPDLLPQVLLWGAAPFTRVR